MKICLHLGAHATDDGRLVRSLLRSRATLAPEVVHIPAPRRYRQILRESLSILNGMPASKEVQQILLDVMVETDGIERLILFHEGLVAIPARAISIDGLYPMAPSRIAAIRNMFPDHETALFLALCNPATMIPALAQRLGADGYNIVMGEASVQRLRWYSTIAAILQANPGVDLTLWCHEDTPRVWPEVLRALGGVAPDAPMEGELDMLYNLLTEEGFAALTTALEGVRIDDIPVRREIFSDHLERMGRRDQLEMDVSLPDWTEELIAEVTQNYIDDCHRIAELPGIKFIAP